LCHADVIVVSSDCNACTGKSIRHHQRKISMFDRFERSRRRFLKHSTVAGGVLATGLPGILRAQQAPAIVGADSARPMALHGLQIGDPLGDRAIVWSRADKDARLFVEWSRHEDFRRSMRARGPHAIEVTGHTARIDLTDLPSDADIFVRVVFESLDSTKARSEPVVGRFRTAPRKHRDVRLLWSGDTAGQGWGINPDFGGMKCYETMRLAEPDFFIHCGDTIYADGPMLDEVKLADGTIWRNAFLNDVPAKRKVAETLDEFRSCYLYNLFDENVRRFNAEVPQIWQWDDHEVTNNWSDSKDLSGDARYAEKRVQTLVGRATRAFLEYAPLRWHTPDESERVYRHIPYGGDLDVFVIDMRSYRGPNTFNRQESPGPETALLGRAQIEWLKAKLKASRATWKIVASDMPIGLLVGDVHYCAAHYYDPARAQFRDFDPFWEFVSGPLNAGTFGPNGLDNTFGPQVVFQKAPPTGQANLPPSAGMQFFGQLDIDHRSKDMLISLKDLNGATLFSQRLHAKHDRRHGR
jgi:alkaline phosphatase D